MKKATKALNERAKSGDCVNDAEKYFEEYCHQEEISFCKIGVGTSKTPDYKFYPKKDHVGKLPTCFLALNGEQFCLMFDIGVINKR